MDSELIDLRTAAEQMGVHYQTAYKWVRSGKLEADLVEGRYLLRRPTVEALLQRRAAPKRPPARQPRGGFDVLAGRMYEALVAGDERSARKLISGLVDDAVPITTAIQDVLVPPLRRIGAEWRDGHLSIWVEHRASAIIERMLGEHHPTPRGRRRGTAMVAAMSGDHHTLPTSMAAAALRDDNWHVHHLGADMPGDQMVQFCREIEIDLAVLTVTAPEVRSDAMDTAAQLERDGVRTLVGRPGGTLAELQRSARAR